MTVIKLEKEWQYPCFCLKCHSVFWSDWEGHFVSCECGACFCDQTPYYSRYGGDEIMVPQRVFEEPEPAPEPKRKKRVANDKHNGVLPDPPQSKT